MAEAGGNDPLHRRAPSALPMTGSSDPRRPMPDLTDEECRARTDFGDLFRGSVLRTTWAGSPTTARIRTSCELLASAGQPRDPVVDGSNRASASQPIWGRQAFLVDGRFKFWGGLTVEAWGGGPGLVGGLDSRARPGRGSRCAMAARCALADRRRRRRVRGCGSSRRRAPRTSRRASVVLAAGGLRPIPNGAPAISGPGWDLAKVRGTRFNTGDGLRMALEIGAMSAGQWSGCHAVGWDRNAPPVGDLAVGDALSETPLPLRR